MSLLQQSELLQHFKVKEIYLEHLCSRFSSYLTPSASEYNVSSNESNSPTTEENPISISPTAGGSTLTLQSSKNMINNVSCTNNSKH